LSLCAAGLTATSWLHLIYANTSTMSLQFTAPASATPTPAMPLSAKAAILVAGAAALLQMTSPLFVPGIPVLVVPLVLMYALLIFHIARGSNIARIGYLVFDVLMLIPLLLSGKFPVDIQGPSPLLDAVLFVLTLAIWAGLLHPKTNHWFHSVKLARMSAPLAEQLAATRTELKLSLVWAVGALAVVRFLAKTSHLPGVTLAVMVAPFLLIGLVVAITQAACLLRLKAQARAHQ
jgi:hypothetical protein